MDVILNLLQTALSFVLILSVVVFIHEFGHFIVARLCGVRVTVFSIGFGRELWGFNDRKGTRWRISLLPLGGYVKMFGDSSEASTPDASLNSMSEEEKRVSFHHKNLWQKALVVVAGPASNFLLTIVILTGFIWTGGLATTEPVVGEIMPDTPAAAAGLKPGDRILSIDGKAVETFNDIPMRIATNLGIPVKLSVLRDETILLLTLTPILFEDEDAFGNKTPRRLIGFKSKEIKLEEVGPARAVGEAVTRTYDICATTLHAVGQMIAGNRDASELKGPVAIAKLSGQASEKGGRMILWFIAMLSANLGLVNLFPIPLLDGGHLVYYAVEAVQGKPMALRWQEYGFRLGFALLATLMAFTLFNDLRQLF